MQDTEFNYTYTAFVSLVNLHLEACHQHPSTSEELMIVQTWHQKAANDKTAYLQCVDEIIEKRGKE